VADPTRRLFVSVDPPPDAVAHLGAVVDTLEVSRANAPGRSTRLAARDRWHVTLAFLGDVAADRVDRAAAALQRAVEASGATEGPIAVTFAGGGTFGRGRFTVLWGGLAGDVAALRRLSEAVRRELRRARLPFDAKAFRPHLTLARPGDRVERDLIAADVAILSGYVGPVWTVDAVHLVDSELGPNPVHTRLASYPLHTR
jgi:RNA 2',3'-cyclic 3'-phosphodiesterase